MALSGATGITSWFELAVLNRANACGGQVVDSESGPFTMQLPSTIEVLHDQRDGRFSEDLRCETLTGPNPSLEQSAILYPKVAISKSRLVGAHFAPSCLLLPTYRGAQRCRASPWRANVLDDILVNSRAPVRRK